MGNARRRGAIPVPPSIERLLQIQADAEETLRVAQQATTAAAEAARNLSGTGEAIPPAVLEDLEAASRYAEQAAQACARSVAALRPHRGGWSGDPE